MRDPAFATLELRFAAEAAAAGTRADGRRPDQPRDARVELGDAWGSAQAWIGRTRAAARVAVTDGPPTAGRSGEGTLMFTVNAASGGAAADDGAARERDAVLRAAVERAVRGARAVDLDALCVVAGKLVWHLRVHVAVVDDCGNAPDAAVLAAVAALLHARRPAVTVRGTDAVVHPATEREPEPLPIAHVPVSATYAVLQGGTLVADPTAVEEAASESHVSVAATAQGEICALHVPGGVPVPADVVVQCARLSELRARNVTKILAAALDKAAEAHPLSSTRPVLGVMRDPAVAGREKQPVRMDAEMAAATSGAWNATPAPDVAPPTVPVTKKATNGTNDTNMIDVDAHAEDDADANDDDAEDNTKNKRTSKANSKARSRRKKR